MNIILFGPPGIGKSTLIGKLKDAGMRAVDLEDIYPSKIRFQLPNMLTGVILGAADLDPKHRYPGCVKVLLTLDQSEYEARRAKRDKLQPSKTQQRKHLLDEWIQATHYDYIIPADRDVLSRVMKLWKWNIFKEENSYVKDKSNLGSE